MIFIPSTEELLIVVSPFIALINPSTFSAPAFLFETKISPSVAMIFPVFAILNSLPSFSVLILPCPKCLINPCKLNSEPLFVTSILPLSLLIICAPSAIVKSPAVFVIVVSDLIFSTRPAEAMSIPPAPEFISAMLPSLFVILPANCILPELLFKSIFPFCARIEDVSVILISFAEIFISPSSFIIAASICVTPPDVLEAIIEVSPYVVVIFPKTLIFPLSVAILTSPPAKIESVIALDTIFLFIVIFLPFELFIDKIPFSCGIYTIPIA